MQKIKMSKKMSRTTRKVLAVLLAAIMIASLVPLVALAAVNNITGIVEMETFLGQAKGLELGEAIANKVVTETVPGSGVFDIELYVAGKNGVPKSYGTDIVFVIDTSGSMSSTDITNARESFISAVDTLFNDPEVGDKSRVALVVFNEWATIANFNQGGTGGARNWTNKTTWFGSNIGGSGTDRYRLSSNPTNSNKLSSGNFWATVNRTNTQAGIHAGHYLLQGSKPMPPSASVAPDYYDGGLNTKIMVVMTDGGPNKFYNDSSNTVNYNDNGITRHVINPTVAPFTTGTWTTGNSAEGDSNSADRAIWQAKHAMSSGISIYAIGYGSYFATNSNGELIGSSVARTTLEGISNRFFTAAGNGAGSALTSIMNGITKIAAVRLNDLTVTDLIGDGFSLFGTIGTVQKASFVPDSTFDSLTWADVTGTEATTNKAVPNGDTIVWDLGAVDDFTMYRITFQIALDSDLENGTYYTNTNAASQFVSAAAGQRSHQTGTHNKLTYSFDGNDETFIIYACEKVTVSNEKPAMIQFGKAIDSQSDNYSGDAPTFSFRVYTDAACSSEVADVEDVTVTGGTVLGSGNVAISISDVRPLIPEGSNSVDLWIKEVGTQTLANGGRWDHDASIVKVTVSDRGIVTYPADWNKTFTNTFTKLYNVTLEYYVDGKYVGTVDIATLEDGEHYDASGLVREIYHHNHRNYYFVKATNSDVVGTATTLENGQAIAEGDIDGADVVIKVYYQSIKLPKVKLNKSITLAEVDMRFPADYSFDFALYDGTKKVAELNGVTSADLGKNHTFTWLKGVKAADLRGKTLTLVETAPSGWSSLVTENGAAYVELDNLLGLKYILNDKDDNAVGKSIVNTYDKDKQPATVDLYKFFDLGELAEEFGEFGFYGGNLTCTETERAPSAAVIEDIETKVYDCECENDEDHDEECDYHIETEYDVEITPADPGHTHDASCYSYTFTFELTDEDGNIVDSQNFSLTAEEIIDYAANVKSKLVQFEISRNDVPAKGEGFKAYTISETSRFTGWADGSEVTVLVNPYGIVKYPGKHAQNASMTNTYGGVTPPSFTFAKTVVDARSLLGATAYYEGDFQFDLFANGAFIDRFTVHVEDGVALETITLPQYIDSTVTLTLKEVNPADEGVEPVEGMTYDGRTITIEIVEGSVVKSRLPRVFVNTLLTPKSPIVVVDKTANVEDSEEEFVINWSYEGFTSIYLLNAEAANDTGSKGIIVGEDFEIKLPLNFTGRLTVSEAEGESENWIYDDSVFTFNYVAGVLVGRHATNKASFHNNYYVPEITLEKEHNQEGSTVEAGTTVTYTLTIVNAGGEILENVEVTDNMLSLGENFKITLNGEELDDGDYSIAGNTFTFNGDLDTDDTIIISYSVTFYQKGEYKNDADVTAKGKETKIEVGNDDDASVTIIVNDPGPGLKVTKKVAEYVEGVMPGDETANYDFEDYVDFTSSGKKAIFKITIENTAGRLELFVTEISDTFMGMDISLDEFFYADGTPFQFGEGFYLEPGATITIYFVTGAITSTGTHVNTVYVSAENWSNDNQQKFSGGDSAEIRASWGGNYQNTYHNVIVNYYDKDTGEVIMSQKVGAQRLAGSSYTESIPAITGYIYDSRTGDELEGTLNSNKVINLYYVMDIEIFEEEEVPATTIEIDEEPEEEQEFLDDEVPLADFPVDDETGMETATDEVEMEIEDDDVPLGELPQTGISPMALPLAIFGLAAIGLGIVLKGFRKEEKEEAN